MLIHRSRSRTVETTTTTAPNAGHFTPIPAGHPASDEVLVIAAALTRFNFGAVGSRTHRPEVPGSYTPACGAMSTEGWARVGAYRARTVGIDPCETCFRQGWGWAA